MRLSVAKPTPDPQGPLPEDFGRSVWGALEFLPERWVSVEAMPRWNWKHRAWELAFRFEDDKAFVAIGVPNLERFVVDKGAREHLIGQVDALFAEAARQRGRR